MSATKSEINIVLAKRIGWRAVEGQCGGESCWVVYTPRGDRLDYAWASEERALEQCVPDFCEDLNEVAKVVGTLLFSQRRAYRRALRRIMTARTTSPLKLDWSELIDADADSRARALYEVLTAIPAQA